jgi:hypothetical protein
VSVSAVAQIAKELGFVIREASFDTGTIILERGDETFKFDGIGATKEALRLAMSAICSGQPTVHYGPIRTARGYGSLCDPQRPGTASTDIDRANCRECIKALARQVQDAVAPKAKIA